MNLDVFLQSIGSLKQHPIIKMSGIDTIVNFTQRAGIGGPILDIADADFVSCLSQNLINTWRKKKELREEKYVGKKKSYVRKNM